MVSNGKNLAVTTVRVCKAPSYCRPSIGPMCFGYVVMKHCGYTNKAEGNNCNRNKISLWLG